MGKRSFTSPTRDHSFIAMVLGSVLVCCNPAPSASAQEVKAAEPTKTEEADHKPARCPRFLAGRTHGRVASAELNEISGLVASRRNSDVLWTHNDSGDAARLFALSTSGKLVGTFELPTVQAVDWEDIAIGPGKTSKEPHIYIADTGDNARRRTTGVLLHRVPEPKGVSATPEAAPLKKTIGPVETFRLSYPDKPHDAETLLVDPRSGEIVLLTKHLLQAPRVFFKSKLDEDAFRLDGGDPLDLALADIPSLLPTGGDVSPDGRWVVVRSYHAAYLWRREPDQPLHAVFSSRACSVPLEREPQGEAIGFAANGRAYFTLSEGEHPPIYRYDEVR